MTIVPFSTAPPGELRPRQWSPSTPHLFRAPEKRPFLVRLVQIVREFRRRQRSRRELARFDATMLKDIGLTYTDAEIEINKAFWRI